MKPPEAELRTDAFPYDYYPNHWGLFPFHEIFAMGEQLPPLEVEHYYICVTTLRNPHPIFLGFDDFAPVWPLDPELSDSIIARRDKLRDSADFRALVRVRKLADLTADGIKRLKDVGADLNEDTCQEGSLLVAITGKYKNLSMYHPDRKPKSGVLFVRYIHEFSSNGTLSQQRKTERVLRIVSADMRTIARSMLYIERIKLRCFMVTTHMESLETVPVDDRDVEWFVQKDRVINHGVLRKWAADAPAKRGRAAQDGRDGWGTWDVQWDQEDRPSFYKKEAARLKYFIAQVRRENENGHLGHEGGSEDEDEDIEVLSSHSNKRQLMSGAMRRGQDKAGKYLHTRTSIKQLDEDGEGIDILADFDQESDGDALLDETQRASSGRKRQKLNTRAIQQSSWSIQRMGRTTPFSLSFRDRVGCQRQTHSPLETGSRLGQSLGASPNQPQAGLSRQSWSSLPGSQPEPKSENQMDFIILSSDHDSSVRNKSHSIHEISSDSETKMGDISDRGESAFANHPAVRRKPTSLRQPRLSSE
ncbi:hypothetical protein FRC09_010459 [Ceratobasidium sp. 395]|nr:hypothetical protein FRC09_010459 [Ceratobasidium sp. 395]